MQKQRKAQLIEALTVAALVLAIALEGIAVVVAHSTPVRWLLYASMALWVGLIWLLVLGGRNAAR